MIFGLLLTELLTFYSANYFGDGNVNCLCGHDDLHNGVECTEESSSTAQYFRTSKRRRVRPRIKLFVEENQNALESSINFYDESSKASLSSVESSSENNFPVQLDENSTLKRFLSKAPLSL